ncbi:GM22769 [Drosophila sechellia]|uniref:GM22769 n=1 Tax=Drosophila sechellia TaxID=7238 RepID=B4I710_DROSE|nr:GM22769 [Drosophila sechellia]
MPEPKGHLISRSAFSASPSPSLSTQPLERGPPPVGEFGRSTRVELPGSNCPITRKCCLKSPSENPDIKTLAICNNWQLEMKDKSEPCDLDGDWRLGIEERAEPMWMWMGVAAMGESWNDRTLSWQSSSIIIVSGG